MSRASRRIAAFCISNGGRVAAAGSFITASTTRLLEIGDQMAMKIRAGSAAHKATYQPW
jgi:hypothetical protein